MRSDRYRQVCMSTPSNKSDPDFALQLADRLNHCEYQRHVLMPVSIAPYMSMMHTARLNMTLASLRTQLRLSIQKVDHQSIDNALQVSAQLLALLSTFAANGQCEKTSYDDFYLEIHSSMSAGDIKQDLQLSADQEVHVIGGSKMDMLPAILCQAVQVRY